MERVSGDEINQEDGARVEYYNTTVEQLESTGALVHRDKTVEVDVAAARYQAYKERRAQIAARTFVFPTSIAERIKTSLLTGGLSGIGSVYVAVGAIN